MKPSLILICISTNWCHNFYDVKYTTRMQFTYVPSTSINKNFLFSKEKGIFGCKRPTHENFFFIKPIPFLKVTKEFFVQWGGGGGGGIAGCCERVTFDIIFILFIHCNNQIEVV